MANMQLLPIMTNTNNSSRFNSNMQYPHIKTTPFGIEMAKKRFNFILLLLDFFLISLISYSEILFIFCLVLNDFLSIFSS
jgi:hypothetical protein